MLGCIFLIVIGLVVYGHWNESRRKRFYWIRRGGKKMEIVVTTVVCGLSCPEMKVRCFCWPAGCSRWFHPVENSSLMGYVTKCQRLPLPFGSHKAVGGGNFTPCPQPSLCLTQLGLTISTSRDMQYVTCLLVSSYIIVCLVFFCYKSLHLTNMKFYFFLSIFHSMMLLLRLWQI